MNDDQFTTYEMADGSLIFGDFRWVTDPESITDTDWDEPTEFVVTEWQAITRRRVLYVPPNTLCEACEGEGRIRNPAETKPGMHINTVSWVKCPSCKGTGEHPDAGTFLEAVT